MVVSEINSSVWSAPAQMVLSSTFSLSLAFIVLTFARRGHLSMRYLLGWLFVSVSIAIGGLLGGLLAPIANSISVHPSVLAIGIACSGLLAITVQLSVTLSGLFHSIRTLAESHALLEARLDALDSAAKDRDNPSD